MKIGDIIDMILKVNEQKKIIEEKYGNKIKEINKKMEDLQNAKDKSQQYIEDQKKKLQKQLDEIIEAQKKKLEQFGKKTAEKLEKTQANAVYDQTKNIAARFGIRLPDIKL